MPNILLWTYSLTRTSLLRLVLPPQYHPCCFFLFLLFSYLVLHLYGTVAVILIIELQR